MGAVHRHVAKRSTGWVELGHISTDTSLFAIVDPCKADVLWKQFQEYLSGKLLERTVDSMPTFDQWLLRRGYEWEGAGASTVLFDTGPEGGFATVEGRFGPYLGQAGDPDEDDYPSMQLVELRIRLHDIDDCDDECVLDRPRRRVRIRRR